MDSVDWNGGMEWWTGLDWTGLDWTGLDWNGMEWPDAIFVINFVGVTEL